MMLRLLILVGLAVFGGALPTHAQTIGQNKEPGASETYTLSVRSQLVVEAVTVKDKQGNAVPGLTANDFTVTEDGVPQKIRFCEYQSLPTTAAPLPRDKDESVTIYRRLARTQLTPETQDDARYKNKRLLALYFDMSAMPPGDQLRALGAAEKFIRTQMTPVDLVSILRFQGGSVDVLQDFTADRNRLLSILETLIVGEGQGSVDSVDDASSADTGAAFGQDDSEFNIFNTDRQLSALQTAAHMLGNFNEKKSLIYFASGMRLNGMDNQAQLHATVDAAIRAGVSFWPIDARGLVAGAPMGDATQGSPGNEGMYSGTAAAANTSDFQQSQDTMYSLAGDTGGKAMLDYNDLYRGIVNAQRAISDYYILGYYTTNAALNGKFRRIKITVARPVDAKLDYRQGYYAGKEFAKFNAADKERQLEDALMLEDPITELTIAMEINYFQLNRAEYFVPIVVKIPGRELALAKRGGAEHTLIDFVGEIKDVYGGNTISNVRDNVNIKLSDATAAQLAHQPVEYDTGFTLLPGKYMIKFLARDDETGRIGTYQTNFTVPNLNKEEKHVPISSVVLSSQQIDLRDVLFNVAHSKKRDQEAAVNPLVQDGKKIIPSVTRVFSADHEMLIYLQAYKPVPQTASSESQSDHPMFAFAALYRGDTKALETPPMAVRPVVSGTLDIRSFSFHFGINGIPPGEYNCQITVLDPTTSKTTFWRAPIVIVR